MDKNDEKRLLADMSHELRTQIDAIQSYGELISAETDDPAIREYAGRIGTAVSGMSTLLGRLRDKTEGYDGAHAVVSASPASPAARKRKDEPTVGTPLVLIVDDDEMICQTAGAFLGRSFRVKTAKSGSEALKRIRTCKPSLILLDVNMPEMDGFETLAKIRRSPGSSPIPVVFLTGDEDLDIEIRCLKAGAADFVRKPLVSQVLVERVRRIIELDRLQNFLSSEVAVQTKRSVHLSKQIMLALSKAVDAKDHYTNGHSRRVAAYSAEIARRMGKSAREQEDIYAMGLLHDVGKIGISEAIINKTSRLDDDEYAQIKNHTTIGYDILKLITEIPGLATGARWHHERYDGRGYPDGLSGTDIPEEARIICVADCYDAMTSNRSYSVVRDQSAVRAEILRCRGSQFDPDISDIMIAMIDDDPDYLMSERDGHDAEIPTAPREYASPGADDADDTEENPETEEESIIPTVEGLDLTYARRNFPDDIMLASTLKNFTELMPSKLEKLAFAYESADNGAGSDSYRIIVHSMKSSSAMVGLIALSELARTLEFMAKDGDIGGIRKLHGKFADDWKCMYERLSEAYEAAKKADRRDTGDGFAVLPELLAMLRLNMENMDIDAADGVMKLICSYSYSPVVTELTEQLKNAVLELDEGAAGNISDMILKELKQ